MIIVLYSNLTILQVKYFRFIILKNLSLRSSDSCTMELTMTILVCASYTVFDPPVIHRYPFVLCQTFIRNIKCSFTALEENMFDTASTSPYPQVFLRPKETVHIPLKFQTFRADQSVPEQVKIHPLWHHDQLLVLIVMLLFMFVSRIKRFIIFGLMIFVILRTCFLTMYWFCKEKLYVHEFSFPSTGPLAPA